MASYRPISLLTSFSKVFKNIMYERRLQHINIINLLLIIINNILVEDQFGFRTAISTDKSSYRLIHEILNV
jgi:hypothetical protein